MALRTGAQFKGFSMPDGNAATDEQTILISDNAARRISELVTQEGKADVMLRIVISGGGCSGFRYGFELDDKKTDDDLVFEQGGARVVLDGVSLDLIKGAELDYVEDLIGSFFALKNPNASSTCGCGTSFSI